jgi:hypothetical protein
MLLHVSPALVTMVIAPIRIVLVHLTRGLRCWPAPRNWRVGAFPDPVPMHFALSYYSWSEGIDVFAMCGGPRRLPAICGHEALVSQSGHRVDAMAT